MIRLMLAVEEDSEDEDVEEALSVEKDSEDEDVEEALSVEKDLAVVMDQSLVTTVEF